MGVKYFGLKGVKIFPFFAYTLSVFFLLFCIQIVIFDGPSVEDNIARGCKEDATLIWWTPFMKGERYIQCGNICCYLTDNRKFKNNQNVAYLFYGSNFNESDLPLPRAKNIWGLLHEESPRNSPLLNHEPILTLFNYSSTFSRFSDVPVTLQYLTSLEDLTSQRYYKTFEQKSRLNLSQIVYIQSDCITPNNRDSYVEELMKYITIDSYGACLNNKKLPNSLNDPMETMMSSQLLQLIGNYKFAIAFENAICEDYITEKLWRPLIAGSVPLYIGSPSVKDWIPNSNAAIFLSDFTSPKELAEYLHYLNSHPEAYNKHLNHKIEQKIENEYLITNFHYYSESSSSNKLINDFECMVCEKLFYNKTGAVTKRHYNCPEPTSILSKRINTSNWWYNDYLKSMCEASILRKYIENSQSYTSYGLEKLGLKFLNEKKCEIPGDQNL